MVTGGSNLIVPMQMTQNYEQILCIIRDCVDDKCAKHLQSLSLPSTTKLGTVSTEISKLCGYVHGSVCIERLLEGDDNGIKYDLDCHPDEQLCDICRPEVRRHYFTVTQICGRLPLRECQAVSSSFPTEVCSYPTNRHGQPVTTLRTGLHKVDLSDCLSYADTFSKSETGFVGLVNQAMTCYLNSLLQTLFMTPEFRNALYRWQCEDGRGDCDGQSIPFQLQCLFLSLQMSDKRCVETTDLTKSFGWDSTEVWQQHDVQELCRVMFDALEMTWRGTNQANLINNLYQGKLMDYVTCLGCQNESARLDSFLDIPLVVRPYGSDQAYSNVEESLDAFVQPETLDGANQYFCEKCNKKCDAHKGLKFITFPYLLTLQLKRFDFDCNTLHRVKLNDRMAFPDILDLNRFNDVLANGEIFEQLGDAGGLRSCKKFDAVGPAFGATGDSGDEATDEGIDLESGGFATSSNSDASSISSEAVSNDRSASELVCKGPYLYELFSIMIHSGSTTGGHYYAYIKSFTDGQWYSFNDQQVTKITYDDIQKTYGGSGVNMGFYSPTYSSSSSAYMLMYRQIDKKRNTDFMQPADFPEHLKLQLQKQLECEDRARRQHELDLSTCKINVYLVHPVDHRKLSVYLLIHKDKTLADATAFAHQLFELEGVVDVSCCRLVKYDDFTESLERSYEGEEAHSMVFVLDGVKSAYNFDFMLETRLPGQTFLPYKLGGVTVKVHLADISKGFIHSPVNVHAYLVQTVDELRSLISQVLDVPVGHAQMCVLRFDDLRALDDRNMTLKASGFAKCSKVYIDCSEDSSRQHAATFKTCLSRLLDRQRNTISVQVNIPTAETVSRYAYSLLSPGRAGGCPLWAMKTCGDAEHDDSGTYRFNERCLSLGGVAGVDCAGLLGRRGDNTDVNMDCLWDSPLSASHSDPVLCSTCHHDPPQSNTASWPAKLSTDLTSLSDCGSNSSMHCSPSSVGLPDSDCESGHGCVDPVLSPGNDLRLAAVGPTDGHFSSRGKDFLDDVKSVDGDILAMGHGDGLTPTLHPLNIASPPDDLTCDVKPVSENGSWNNYHHELDHAHTGFCSNPGVLPTANSLDNGCVFPVPATGIECNTHPVIPTRCADDLHNELHILTPLPPSLSPCKADPFPAILTGTADVEERVPVSGYSDPILTEQHVSDLSAHHIYSVIPVTLSEPDCRALMLSLDKRITLADFKREMEQHIEASSLNFRVYRVCTSGQECEVSKLNESMPFADDRQLNIRMGRALQLGEHRVDVHRLDVHCEDETEHSKLLTETIIVSGMTVLQSKHMIVSEVRDKCGLEISVGRCRLREKFLKNPGPVYLNHQVFGDDIPVSLNWGLFLEILDKDDAVYSIEQVPVYLQRWRPSTLTLDPIVEVVLSCISVEELFQKAADIDGLCAADVELVKGRFLCATPLISMQTELDWKRYPEMSTQPNHGQLFHYRDKTEEPLELTEGRRKELERRWHKSDVRTVPNGNKPSTCMAYKERDLKIYTGSHLPPPHQPPSYSPI